MKVTVIDEDLGIPTDVEFEVISTRVAFKLEYNGEEYLIWQDMTKEVDD